MKRLKISYGFSLIEVLIVISILSLLIGLAAPAFVSLSPVRKSGIYELKAFIEFARQRAVSDRRDTYVVFADEKFPNDSGAFSAYAMFAAVMDEESKSTSSNQESPVLTQPLSQLTEWKSIGEGLVFAKAEDFEIPANTSFRTLLESPWRRLFFTILTCGGSNPPQMENRFKPPV